MLCSSSRLPNCRLRWPSSRRGSTGSLPPKSRSSPGCRRRLHRRFIKTHTPLDGIPLSPLATYIVVGRHPLDAAVSLYHQSGNINRDRLAELTGIVPDQRRPDRPPRPPVAEWLRKWIDADDTPVEYSDSLRGVLWHASDAWSRRADPGLSGPKIVLLHYDELSADLDGQMRALARVLGIEVAEDRWPDLVQAASFTSMRAAAQEQAPTLPECSRTGRILPAWNFWGGPGVADHGGDGPLSRSRQPVRASGRAGLAASI